MTHLLHFHIFEKDGTQKSKRKGRENVHGGSKECIKYFLNSMYYKKIKYLIKIVIEEQKKTLLDLQVPLCESNKRKRV